MTFSDIIVYFSVFLWLQLKKSIPKALKDNLF
jgi:hypothetical protein